MKTEFPRGYEPLHPEWIAGELTLTVFSSRIIYRERIASTNDLAKQLAADGAPGGTLVLAEEQTGGRGRRGKSWSSPAGVNLLFSVLLRPNLQADRVFVLTMILALAALDALKAQCGLSAGIKWPNDLYGGMKKLAGILTEFSTKDRWVDWVVLGLGMNVNWHPHEMSAHATSVFAETGVRVSRNGLLVEILKQFESHYQKVLSGKTGPFYERWNEACFILGKPVQIESGKERMRGTALRIDHDGALIVQTEQGLVRRVVAGDVSLRLEA